MSHADDKARAAIERLVPAWARDWVPLRLVQTQQLGRSQADAKLFVPATVGHIANAARMKLEFESPQDDEAQLRVLALLPPVEIMEDPARPATSPKGAVPSAKVPGPAPAATPAAVASPVPAELALPAMPAEPAKATKRLRGCSVRVITEVALQCYVAESEVLGKRKARDDAKADKELAAALQKRGGLRTVVLRRSWSQQLARLRAEMPNFAAVVDHVEAACEISALTGLPLRIPAMLLVGLPGLGKTLFAARLATALGVPRYVFALESAETLSTLAGSDKHWANTEPGQIFRHVVLGEVANPMIVLDEVDKARNGPNTSNGYRPAAALLGVLEPVTAKEFRDKSADLCFDASHVIYVATANRLSGIEGSLLSRLVLFHIEAPDARAAVAIARSVASALIAELGLADRFRAVGGEVLQQLALLGSPRLQRQVLQSAIGRAVHSGRTELRAEDLQHRGATTLGGTPH